MEEMGSEGDHYVGYMLVPWASWDQWNFVRESLFSASPDSVAAALRRIVAWRSRGCLPVSVEITAAIIEIQQKDPFFSGMLSDEVPSSEEILVMLYSMVIMRLVNGFVENVNGIDNFIVKHQPHKKKYSIFQVADAIGIPRMLVDIRHESSHRDLPSLPLLRLAIMKALDWLKSHYWEPQRKMIPDVKKEVKSRLHQMVTCLKITHGDRSTSSQAKGKRLKQAAILRVCNKLSGKLLSSKNDGSRKRLFKTSKILARLFSEHPKEVVSSLLEIYTSERLSGFSDVEIGCNDDSVTTNMGALDTIINIFKAITSELSRRSPGLLPTMLKEVLRMIEVNDALHDTDEIDVRTVESQASISQNEHLSSLVLWLAMKLKELKNYNQIVLDETQTLSRCTTIIPRVSLMDILHKCLLLSASGNKYLSDSAIFISEIIADDLLIQKIKKLPLIDLQFLDFSLQDSTSQYTECDLLKEEYCLNQAVKELEVLRSTIKESSVEVSVTGEGNLATRKRWTLAKSWTTCPIGMVPCPFSSLAFLPDLDEELDGCENKGKLIGESEVMKNITINKRETSCDSEMLDNASPLKKARQMPKCDDLHFGDFLLDSPVKGRLLIDGIWRTVSEEELLSIGSNIQILM